LIEVKTLEGAVLGALSTFATLNVKVVPAGICPPKFIFAFMPLVIPLCGEHYTDLVNPSAEQLIEVVERGPISEGKVTNI
jgi:hypothetical protein